MKQVRVVVTGMGVISPAGNDVHTFWGSLVEGRNTLSEVRSFDTRMYPHHLGCEVALSEQEMGALSKAERRLFGRAAQFAILAAHQAIEEAGFVSQDPSCTEKTAVIIGTTFGEAQIIERATKDYVAQGTLRNSNHISQYMPNVLSVNIAKRFGFSVPNMVIPTACSAGNYAISWGATLIQSGKADFAVVGGADPFSEVSFSGFSRLGVMSPTGCQPFDRNRHGMVVGEGAGILVLERLDLAARRGARIYAEILSCGFSCDATHMTIPDVHGVEAMIQDALEKAGLSAPMIDYICAHGTGTPMNDKTESAGIRRLFYEKGHRVPVSSIKSMIGHTMGAASAIGAIASIMALETQTIPPTINFETEDPECGIDCVPNKAISKELRYVLNNSLAFGGNNASLLIGQVN